MSLSGCRVVGQPHRCLKLYGRVIQNHKFLNQISVAKNYLYNTILKSLKSYRQISSKRDEVKNLLEDVSVLFDKRLFAQANKLLRRCRKLTENYEMFSEIMQILIWELKIVVMEKTYEKKTDEIINREKPYLVK